MPIGCVCWETYLSFVSNAVLVVAVGESAFLRLRLFLGGVATPDGCSFLLFNSTSSRAACLEIWQAIAPLTDIHRTHAQLELQFEYDILHLNDLVFPFAFERVITNLQLFQFTIALSQQLLEVFLNSQKAGSLRVHFTFDLRAVQFLAYVYPMELPHRQWNERVWIRKYFSTVRWVLSSLHHSSDSG